MEEKSATSDRQHDLARRNIFEGASSDLDYIAGPQGWQHAFAVNTQSQSAASAQAIRSESGAFREPDRRRGDLGIQRQEVLRED